MKRGVLIGLLALFFLLCTCTAGSAVQEQKENGIAHAGAGSIMELETNKKDEEELEDAESLEDDATELVELEEQSEAGLERRKKEEVDAPGVDALKEVDALEVDDPEV